MINPPTNDSEFNAFVWAISQQESGGSYKDVNSSSGALGKYQIMPANVSSWSQEVLGRSIDPTTFLNSPALQDQIAKGMLWKYYSKYGPGGAAAVWYSGSPNVNATYGNPPVYQYVKDVLARMAGFNANSGAGGNTPGASGSGNGSLLSPSSWLSGIANLFGASDLKDMFERLGFILLGATLIFVGLILLGFSFFSGANKKKNESDVETKELNRSQENPVGQAIAGNAVKEAKT